MKKIAIITTRFGKYLNYFQLWIESIKFNSDIDFYLITDNWIFGDNKPLNLHVIDISFEEMGERIQKYFNFKIVLDRPYKITEYQPAFGLIFEKELERYDFWGYCDNDIILGYLRKFFSENILDQNERIYFKDHMTLYKNNEKMKKLFMKTLDEVWSYKKAFTTSYICYFGEGTLTQTTIRHKLDYYNNEDEYADVMYQYYNFRLANNTKFHPVIFKWISGHLYGISKINGEVKKEEYSYIHLQKRDMRLEVNKPEKGFLIVPNAFKDINDITPQQIEIYSKDKLSWHLNYIWKYRIKGIIKKIKYGALKQRIYMLKRKQKHEM